MCTVIHHSLNQHQRNAASQRPCFNIQTGDSRYFGIDISSKLPKVFHLNFTLIPQSTEEQLNPWNNLPHKQLGGLNAPNSLHYTSHVNDLPSWKGFNQTLFRTVSYKVNRQSVKNFPLKMFRFYQKQLNTTTVMPRLWKLTHHTPSPWKHTHVWNKPDSVISVTPSFLKCN